MVLILFSSIWKNPGRQKKCCHLSGKSWIHTQELQDYFDILLVPCNTSQSHKCLMEKQQKMRSAAAFRDQIYVAEHFFRVRFKGQKKVDRLNLLILPTLKAPFRDFSVSTGNPNMLLDGFLQELKCIESLLYFSCVRKALT